MVVVDGGAKDTLDTEQHEMQSRRTLLASIFLPLLACGDPAPRTESQPTPPISGEAVTAIDARAPEGFEPPTIDHWVVAGEEIYYLRNRRGTIELPPASEPFTHIEIHASLGAMEVRATDEAGAVVLDWSAVEPAADDSQPAAIERELVLDRPAVRLWFRSAEGMEFARFAVSDHAHGHDSLDATWEGGTTRAAIAGRWIPSNEALELANQQYLPYSGAPSSCSGTFLAGTREVADYLKATFEGATSYGGYSCRANTANTSQLSVHASGRAIDLFVPLDGGEADNDLGDPIANYLIANSEELGIEFIVWDRTSWGAHRDAPKHRAYTGPHPHHDHLHIELSPSSARTTGRTFPTPGFDEVPRGYLDAADCEGGISGWAQDPDAPDDAIDVYVSIGGPVFTEGAVGYTIKADRNRDDLCTAIGSCNHGYQLPVPRKLMDGQTRQVFVYGMDVTGPNNAELVNSGRTIQCAPPSLPYAGDYGIRRHIPNPEVLDAWRFDRNDIATIADAKLDELPLGTPLGAAPQLAQVDGEDAVWLVEDGVRRHVPNRATMETWKFDWDTIQMREELAELVPGVPVTPRPFLARGSGPAVYLIEPPAPLWAEGVTITGPPALGKGQAATFEVAVRNRGSLAWEPGLFELRSIDEIECIGCGDPLNVPIEPGQSSRLAIQLTAPRVEGRATACFELYLDGFGFSGPGQGGPSEPVCVAFDVQADGVELPDDQSPGVVDDDGVASFDDPSVNGRGGCSAAGGAEPAGASMLMMMLGFLATRRRRAR